MSKVATGGHLGHSNHEAIEFKISADSRKSASKSSVPDKRRADFRLLKEFVTEVPWENAFAGAGEYHCWSLIKYHILRAQEQAVHKYHKSGSRQGRRPCWLKRDLLLEIRQKTKVYALL